MHGLALPCPTLVQAWIGGSAGTCTFIAEVLRNRHVATCTSKRGGRVIRDPPSRQNMSYNALYLCMRES